MLTPSTGLLFWMSLTFLVVLAILWKWGFPVIVNMVRDRKAFIDDSLRKAHEANLKLTNIQKEGEAILQEARAKAAQTDKENADLRAKLLEQAKEKAHAEGKRLIDEAKAEIDSQKKAAVSEIRSIAATLSVEIAEKLLLQKLGSDKEQMALIDRMLNEMSSKK